MKYENAVNGHTRLFGVIGRPVRHSLSPLIHNTGYITLGMNCLYLAFEVNDLKKTFEGLKEMGVSGFNVTMPFKQEIMKYLDRIDESARKVKAVNTVVDRKGKFVGYNTDGIGAVNALKKVTRIKGKKVLLFGAGGAGRAIAFALQKEKAKITISEKTASKGKALAKEVGGKFMSLAAAAKTSPDIIINATPAGMKPNINSSVIPKEFLRKQMVVFDIVYNPLETKLLKDAKKVGCRTINGVEMLLEQAYDSFEIFTGKKAPRNEIRKAVLRELMLKN